MDCSLPGSSVHGILQARILERVAIPLSRGIFSAQGLNPGILHCRQILFHLSHQERPQNKRMNNNNIKEPPLDVLCPWNSSGENTGEGCYVLLHSIAKSQTRRKRLSVHAGCAIIDFIDVHSISKTHSLHFIVLKLDRCAHRGIIIHWRFCSPWCLHPNDFN